MKENKPTFFKELNPEQQAACVAISGPSLILAGAGSGKTRVLVYKIAYLVGQGIYPENILAVTFTNKAADEIKKRVMKILGQKKLSFPWLGTFHSLGVKILRREAEYIGVSRDFTIYDEDDQRNLIKAIIRKLDLDVKKFNPAAVAGIISRAKGALLTPVQYKELDLSYFERQVAEIYPVYETELARANAFDFDDLIVKTIELFRKNSKILEKYKKLFKYILIDEYQDTDKAQYMLIKMLVSDDHNISVVGDPDQAIYGWRGADISNILNFEEDFPNAKIFKLEQNYRSTKNILSAAQAVIDNNVFRKEKDLWTENEEGEPIGIYEAVNEIDEANFVIRKIADLKTGNSFNRYAVFYRTHAQSRVLEEALLSAGLPYRIVGGVRFYERREVKDLIAWLRVLTNPLDGISLARIINVPARGVGEGIINKAREEGMEFLKNTEMENLPARSKNAINNFSSLYNKFKKSLEGFTADELLSKILIETGYKEWILDGTEEGETRFENIKELISVSQKYREAGPRESVRRFLEEVALIQAIDNWDKEEDAVTLMTLHSAKGLEFPIVFMIGMEEGIFPHSRSLTTPQELEEERRLCYVGMTRAQEKLFLTHASQRLFYGQISANAPSRFLEEFEVALGIEEKEIGPREEYQEEISFALGSRVWHNIFGEGVITKISKDILTVDFETAGIKNIIADPKYIKSLDA